VDASTNQNIVKEGSGSSDLEKGIVVKRRDVTKEVRLIHEMDDLQGWLKLRQTKDGGLG